MEICLNLMHFIFLEVESVEGKNSILASPTMVIIILCTLSFFLEMIPYVGYFYVSAFQFDPNYLVTRPWTLVTYMFLHTSLLHLLFNMLVLYFWDCTRNPSWKQTASGNLFHLWDSVSNRVHLFKWANFQYLTWSNDWCKWSDLRSLCSSYNA